jgi:hypothetical protein
MKRDMGRKLLSQSPLDYDQTHQRVMIYFRNSAADVREGRAHVQFHDRGECTRATIRARRPGEACPDQAEGAGWFLNLALLLERGEPCGKVTLIPNGESTEITVRFAN